MKRITFLSAGFALLIAVQPLRAENAAPAPAAKAPAKKAPAKPAAAAPDAADPTAAAAPAKAADPAAPAPVAPGKAPPAPEPPAYRPPDAATQTILDSNPKTPQELVQVVISLTALDHPELAKPFVQQLIAAKFDPDTAADIVHRFGSAALIQLAGDPRLRPEAATFADRVLALAAAQIHDPARLAGRVQKLGDPSAEVQRDALAALHDGGAFSVSPLLAALVDPAQQKIHSLAHGAMLDLGSEAIRPLAAALEAPDAAIKIEAIDLLADLGESRASVYLLRPYLASDSPGNVRQAAGDALEKMVNTRPSAGEAVALLIREVRGYLDGERILRPDLGDDVTIWNWNPTTHSLISSNYPSARAASFVAHRLAGDLYDLAPNSLEARRLYLLSLLESSVYRVGLDRPLPSGPGSAVQRAVAFRHRRAQRCPRPGARDQPSARPKRRPRFSARSATSGCSRAMAPRLARWSRRCWIPTAGCGSRRPRPSCGSSPRRLSRARVC